MESVILLSSFIVIALGGIFFMGKIDKFLDSIKEANKKETYILRIAVSDFYAAYAASSLLSEMLEQYPHLQYTLWIGQTEEVLHSFDKKKADVIIISSNTEYSKHSFRYISLGVRPFKISKNSITLTPLAVCTQQQKIFWQNDRFHPLVPEFIGRFCQN